VSRGQQILAQLTSQIKIHSLDFSPQEVLRLPKRYGWLQQRTNQHTTHVKHCRLWRTNQHTTHVKHCRLCCLMHIQNITYCFLSVEKLKLDSRWTLTNIVKFLCIPHRGEQTAIIIMVPECIVHKNVYSDADIMQRSISTFSNSMIIVLGNRCLRNCPAFCWTA
jgi:hypothetical protein